MKPGIFTGLKALLYAKTKTALIVLTALGLLTVSGCGQVAYVSALDLTATAMAPTEVVEPTAVPATPSEDPVVLSEPTPGVTLTETRVPTEDITVKTVIPTVEVIIETPAPTATRNLTPQPPYLYYTQSGDTLDVVAARFGVYVDEINTNGLDLGEGLINPGTLLIIPNVIGETVAQDPILPDSEIIYSPSALDFDMESFVADAGGYLSTYREYLLDNWYSGAEIIERVAREDSINPRLLLGLLEYQGHWVYGQPANLAEKNYPLGFVINGKEGLYKQLALAVQQLAGGYYGWREGRLTEVIFSTGETQRIHPSLNAGSVALQFFFANFYDPARWLGIINGPASFPVLFETMFGSPWLRAQTVEPLYPLTLQQPPLELPFMIGKRWSFTGGPHPAWGPKGAWAAIDFAPASDQHGCVTSDEWVTASAAGLVVRTGTGVVVVDLDGDGYEQTGWVMLYLHIASKDKVKEGTWLEQDDRIGHPSCEGGSATGTHVHIARKYNGEWIAADGPLAFNLSGWTVHKGDVAYEGTLTRGDEVVTARTYGSYETLITR